MRAASEWYSRANGAGLDLQAVDRDGEVRFEYLTPLSAPIIAGTGARANSLSCEGDHVLVFGMLESIDRAVDAGLLVFDPQQPGCCGGLDLTGLESAELRLVLNAREASGATGESDPEVAEHHQIGGHSEDRELGFPDHSHYWFKRQAEANLPRILSDAGCLGFVEHVRQHLHENADKLPP